MRSKKCWKMDKKELQREVDESESYYRVTMNGNFEDFKTIDLALAHIKKNFNYYSSIRHIKFWK